MFRVNPQFLKCRFLGGQTVGASELLQLPATSNFQVFGTSLDFAPPGKLSNKMVCSNISTAGSPQTCPIHVSNPSSRVGPNHPVDSPSSPFLL